MTKGRVRAKGGRGSKWLKGQSSASNPKTRTHRNAAKGKFGNHLTQGTAQGTGLSLTKTALASHDGSLIGSGPADEGSETTSCAASSVYSLIETSNPVFGKVKNLWNSHLESHREVCAVLAAVSEVIKSREGNDTETEYFAALLTALESSDDEHSTAAVAYLLTIVMDKVSPSVLQSQFGAVCKILTTSLTAHLNSESTALLRSLIVCVGTLLFNQLSSVWSDSSTTNVFQTLLNFTIHPKPKVRKAAQRSVVLMLREGAEVEVDVQFHPTCKLVAKHCKHMIETRGMQTSTLHVIVLLKDCMANLPTQTIKTLCERVLKLLTLGNSVVKTSGLQCLQGLFTSVVGPQGLTSQLNGQLISALYDHQPSLVDAQLLITWLATMESAHDRLYRLDVSMCLAHLPKLYAVCMKCLLAERSNVAECATGVMKRLLINCVSNAGDSDNQHVLAMFRSVESGLKYKYCSRWSNVLSVLETFYTTAGPHCHKHMTKSLQSLAELRNTPRFRYVSELDCAVGAAFRAIGPQVVLNAVPLQLDVTREPLDFPRSWLLVVMREYVRGAQLLYYVEHLLPLTGQMRTHAQEWREKGKEREAMLFDTLESQLWSLLPAFCTDPTDLCQCFRSLARTLGSALMERRDLVGTVCHALQLLVERNKHKDEERDELSRFAKNYLPILFNLYTADPVEGEPSRVPVLDCIRAYLSITNTKLLESLFSKLLSKMREPGTAPHVRTALEDMAEVFVPHLPLNTIEDLYELLKSFLDSTDRPTQKKAYKLLSVILSCDSADHSTFTERHLADLPELLTSSLSTTSGAAKRYRLKCILEIVNRLKPGCSNVLASISPEVILCTKETNEKCRVLSLKVMVAMAHSAQRCLMKPPEDAMREFFLLVLAGLAGSPRMIAATIGCLGRLAYEFHDLIGSELLQQLLSGVCAFFTARSREVVKAALEFIKVMIGVLPPSELSGHVEELVLLILKWNENGKNHFRFKARVLIERLIKKFGADMIGSIVPDKHKKLVTNIRKTNERLKRRKKERDQEGKFSTDSKKHHIPSYEELIYSDDEEEEEGTTRPSRRDQFKDVRQKKRQQGSAWLKEGDEDEPLNFLDPTAAKRVLTTDPRNAKRKRSLSHDFKSTADGKLVIEEEEEDKAEENSRAKISRTYSEDASHDLSQSKRKRKLDDDDSDGEDKSDSYTGMSYGSGIHRKNPKIAPDSGAEFKSKKARGDVKRHGKPDPYAYIQLNRQKLNRRKQAKLSGQFESILKKGKKGSAAGTKQLNKRRTKK